MDRKNLRNAFGSTPASFRNDVNEALERLEERDMIKHYKATTLLPIAALIMLLLAGTACAAVSGLRLFERHGAGNVTLTPLPEADALVQTDVVDAAGDLVRLELEEALYDGRRALFLLRLTPTDPERYALLEREEGAPPEDGPTETCAVVQKDSGEAFRCKVIVDAGYDAAALEDTELQGDGSLLVWGQLDFRGDPPETVPCSAEAILCRAAGGEIVSAVNAMFALTRTNEERTARLEPLADGDAAGFEILSASLSTTPVRGMFTMEFTCEKMIHFTYRDETGAELPVGVHEVTPHRHGDAESWEYRWETAPWITFPETITIEGDREGVDYGSVTCRVIPD